MENVHAASSKPLSMGSAQGFRFRKNGGPGKSGFHKKAIVKVLFDIPQYCFPLMARHIFAKDLQAYRIAEFMPL